MNNITEEYHKAYVEESEKVIDQYKIKTFGLSKDTKTFMNMYFKASKILKLIADKYNIPEAKEFFNDSSKQN